MDIQEKIAKHKRLLAYVDSIKPYPVFQCLGENNRMSFLVRTDEGYFRTKRIRDKWTGKDIFVVTANPRKVSDIDAADQITGFHGFYVVGQA